MEPTNDKSLNRRDFFSAKDLGAIAAPFLGAYETNDSPPPENTYLTFSRQAMATTFEVVLPYATPQATQAAYAALDLIDDLESQMTVYRDDSEISELNRMAAVKPMRVERRLYDLLRLAKQLHDDSDGAFDISVGALIKAWGFYRRRGCVPSDEERAEVQQKIGMNHVEFRDESHTVRFQKPGLELNLGSIGKGYALDRAAEMLFSQWSVSNAMLHGGRSSAFALGNEPGTNRGWSVGLLHPANVKRRWATVRLRNRGLSTSAITFQHLEHNGRRLGHILDPRTAWPAENMLCATVLAPTAAEADALATSFYILGCEKARAYCETHPEIAAVLFASDSARPVVINIPVQDISIMR